MRRFILPLLAAAIVGCASEEPKLAPPKAQPFAGVWEAFPTKIPPSDLPAIDKERQEALTTTALRTRLILNEDSTYSAEFYSDNERKMLSVIIEGVWELQKNEIRLTPKRQVLTSADGATTVLEATSPGIVLRITEDTRLAAKGTESVFSFLEFAKAGARSNKEDAR